MSPWTNLNGIWVQITRMQTFSFLRKCYWKCLLQNNFLLRPQCVNPCVLTHCGLLKPILQHRCWSTLAQAHVMACCMMASSHYLSLFTTHQWVLFAFTWEQFQWECCPICYYSVNKFENEAFDNTAISPSGHCVKPYIALNIWHTAYSTGVRQGDGLCLVLCSKCHYPYYHNYQPWTVHCIMMFTTCVDNTHCIEWVIIPVWGHFY